MGATNAIVSPTERPAERRPPDGCAALRLATRLDPHYLFYCCSCGQNENSNKMRDEIGGGLHPPYWWTVWRPRSWPALPPGLLGSRLRLRFLFRWAVHRLHLFAGSGCGVLLIYDRRRLVHYSGFTPRYWRFPFVADDDFQIGDTWTDPAHRGRGLALFALQTIVTTLAKPGRRLWYVVEAVNEPSIRVAEKARFTLAAEGTWVMPWGLKLAGAYVIRRNCSA
jgi:RimJ/RimL family protein N-acetyltransferase